MGHKIIVLIAGVSSGIGKVVAGRLIGGEYAANLSNAVAEVDTRILVRKHFRIDFGRHRGDSV
jgi:hypothetical protein